MKLRYLGHSAFEVRTEAGQTILIDPYLDGNPASAVRSNQIKADYIVLTHAHGDHVGDAFKIAGRCQPLFICVSELAHYVSGKGFKAHAMHIGGGHGFPFGRLKFTIAVHGSQTTDGHYAGLAAGVLLFVDGNCVYHAGDTGLFYDMKLIGEMNPIDYMLVPIGDNFTMGVEDAVKAVELAKPKTAIPMHYNTFPLIKADPEAFRVKVESLGIRCLVMKPGDSV
jgi:L-ascorbate metabolism protein UlaG (beta-lactamase superfamily)